MATLGPDPAPIPEHFRWDGSITSTRPLVDWARRTRDHYELPYEINAARHLNGHVILYAETPQRVQTLARIEPGQQLTFTEGQGFHVRPELGADIPRDHPPTLRELTTVLHAGLEREAAINAAMNRHPSGRHRGPSGP